MTNTLLSEKVSTTGAANARLIRRPDGRVIVQLGAPIGAGRRLRLDLGVGQCRATSEVLAAIVSELDRLLYPRERGEDV